MQDLLSNDIVDLIHQDLRIVKPILRHDPSEYRLKPEYRRLIDSLDLPDCITKDCFMNNSMAV
ncbi:MAG: hypothetical protein R3C05_09730 [Pirellulaceae bacterium]